jgi:predicted ester cyclase
LSLDQYRQASTARLEAFPDVRFTVTHLMAAYIKNVFTHSGPFGPVAPMGRVLTFTGAYHCRMVDGRLVEDWDSWTVLPLFQQTVAVLQT